MKTRPLVSIIMPTYNRAYIIKTAVSSMLKQTYPNWELIIVDDGSTDKTKRIIESYKNKQVKYFYQKNKGPAAARNFGLTKAKGRWIAYLDSDNELLPSYLEVMLNWLKKNPRAVFAIPRGNRTLELYKNGKLVKKIDDSKDTPPNLTLKDIFMKKLHLETNGFIHLKKIISKEIKWDTKVKAMEDWDFAMTIGSKYPKGFLYVPVVLYSYHQRYGGDGVVSNSTYDDWAKIFEYIYKKHKNDKLLKGQDWYPAKVQKWKRLQKEFEQGKLPPYYLYYFSEATLSSK